MKDLTLRVHSLQSMGALDGPGIRFVVFAAGCPLRCGCCHNPDTWDIEQGTPYTPKELVAKALRFREYFGKDGGVTLSGGEPLLQADAAKEFFALCHKEGLHTCLDTSGALLDENVLALLDETDRVLLDIKYTEEKKYLAHVGCSIEAPLAFLKALEEKRIPTTLRQVIIPTLNDDKENAYRLRDIAKAHACVDKVELLPFRKICEVKYRNLAIDFPFAHLPEPGKEQMKALEALLK
ncbi:MAG: pyruvate formate lyase-activating protein [Clostridia bacterium]|nr:pyruvate formate lyase-activating protein [Clostridia bacterium]